VHVSHRGTLCRGPALPHLQSNSWWPPRAVLTHVAEIGSKAWDVDLRCLGHFLRTRASPVASPANSASSPMDSTPHVSTTRQHIAVFFFFVPLGFGFVGFWGFWWVCWVGVVRGKFGSLIGGFYCFEGDF
jgi:hypothetical protein